MAISWLTVLQHVPWSDVISNAPAVADGARKLWKNVARRGEDGAEPQVAAGAAASAAAASEGHSPEARALAALTARAHALERQVADLHQQMQESSELIARLADQNTQLVQRIELNRKRMALTAAAAGLALALSAGWIVWTLTSVS